MTNEHNAIDFDAFTKPKKTSSTQPAEVVEKPPVQESTSWPSRQPSEQPAEPAKVEEGQISIKGPLHIIERFKAMCKDDRRVYYDMLEIMMDNYENK